MPTLNALLTKLIERKPVKTIEIIRIDRSALMIGNYSVYEVPSILIYTQTHSLESIDNIDRSCQFERYLGYR